MHLAVLSLGSNLGDREKNLAAMRDALTEVLHSPVRSSVCVETEPVGVDGPQPWYLNQIISGGYDGSCRELLAVCRGIEERLGRVRQGVRAPRTADVDILIYGDAVIADVGLIVPHPALVHRRFLVEGLASIHPKLQVPGLDATAEELLARMDTAVRLQAVREYRVSDTQSTMGPT